MVGAKIMVVEDSGVVLLDIQRSLKSLKYEIAATASSKEDALRKVAQTHPDLVLMDIRLGDEMSGFDAADEIRSRFDIPVVYLSGYSDEETLRRAQATGPFGYILKPFDYRTLHTMIEMALYKHQIDRKLKQSEERYRQLVESMEGIVWEVSLEPLAFRYVSPKLADILGYDPASWAGDMECWRQALYPEDCAEVLLTHIEQARQGILPAGGVLEYRMLTAAGQVKWLRDIMTLVWENGRPAAVRGIMVDISDRKRAEEEAQRLNLELEKRVAERTAQLETANRELEAFSYSISHDLRAPLRTIDGFSRILVNEYGAQLPPDALELFRHVRQGAQQMGRLIDDLLQFSRLNRQPLTRRRVDMDLLVRQALDGLSGEYQGRKVDIVINELPACQGDATLLRQVWINLLSNALKFTRKQAAARVEVGWSQQDGKAVYFVRDNGAGFDMQYVDKLFGVFQRLHSVEEYDGTGVGLAIVHRIITRHGGRVWVNAVIEQGATFYFTL